MPDRRQLPDPFLDALDKYGLPRSENHNPVLVD